MGSGLTRGGLDGQSCLKSASKILTPVVHFILLLSLPPLARATSLSEQQYVFFRSFWNHVLLCPLHILSFIRATLRVVSIEFRDFSVVLARGRGVTRFFLMWVGHWADTPAPLPLLFSEGYVR